MSNQETFRRRHLPHWDVPGAVYFVTACLEGSIPARGLLDVRRYQDELARRPRSAGTSAADSLHLRSKLLFARRDRWMDEEPAVAHLANDKLASIVQEALFFFAGTRYDLLAFVVMPSHFHWVFQPLPSWTETLEPDGRTPRERIMHGIKRHTARECNRLLGLQGPFWQAESYDHWVRDVDELERIVHYVENNPVKAKLCEEATKWRFGSAAYRHDHRSEPGMPLV